MKTFFKPFTISAVTFLALASISTKPFSFIPPKKFNSSVVDFPKNSSSEENLQSIIEESVINQTSKLVTILKAPVLTETKPSKKLKTNLNALIRFKIPPTITIDNEPKTMEEEELERLIRFKVPVLDNEEMKEVAEFELNEMIKFKIHQDQ